MSLDRQEAAFYYHQSHLSSTASSLDRRNPTEFLHRSKKVVVMPVEDSLKRIEERLTRLEAVLVQQPGGPGGFTAPGGAVVDPAPWPQSGWVIQRPILGPYPISWQPIPWPIPIPTVADPAPWGGGNLSSHTAASTLFGRIGRIGDPPPTDVSRLSVSQLESALHTIAAERSRLDATEQMITQQLERARQQG